MARAVLLNSVTTSLLPVPVPSVPELAGAADDESSPGAPTPGEFVGILKKYCSTVSLTKDEHTEVTKISRQDNGMFNWEIYEKCGIVVAGLEDLIWDITSENMTEKEKQNFELNYKNYKENYANLFALS